MPSSPAPDHPHDDSAERGPRGIQSIEVGGQLLLALAHHGRPLPLKDLAREAGMSPAKAHPYLVSFQKIGLVEQEAEGGRYGLGALALQMGLIGLQQYDPVRLATPLIEELAAQTGLTVAIAVWGNRGPTLVRIAEAPSPVHVSMRHGTVMSLRDTASGRLFAAWLPKALWQPLLALEAQPVSAKEMQVTLATVRAEGLARVDGTAVPGVSAMAVPVWDGAGHLVLALTAIGPSATVDLRLDGLLAGVLQAQASGLSQRLGYRPQAAKA
ncbi:MAG: IclR family transcriptional regulator [Ideonella sp. MAG2]|nr:MAG: IclR family transcriptional regulator [Ideonella sp. MAG2]